MSEQDSTQTEEKMGESVLDFPKDGLDPVMWTSDDPPQLTPEAETAINEVVEWVKGRHQIPELSVLVIGSMTSNSYTADSDVDVDFCSHFMDDKTEDERSDFGWKIKSDFMQNYPAEKAKIGNHPIEIFFQPNQFQCMMSVGCYNFLEKRWEVGPEMKNAGYDPVSDMYEESMKQVKHLVKGIRNIILDVYETSLVILKSDDREFRDTLCNELLPKLTSAGEMFKRLKKARSAFQKDPISKEDALKKREDRKWKITDAAFKFFDKFGYVAILRECLTLDEKIQAEGMPVDDIAQAIVDVVKDNLATNKLLSDSEKELFFEVEEKNSSTITESVAQMRPWLEVLFESKKTETNEWGEKQTELGAKSKIFKEVDRIVSSCKTKSFFKSKSGKETDMSTLRLASLAQVEGGHYIATVYGGENGWGEFQSYLKTVKQLVDKIGEKFSKPWLIDWKNDCLDDVWTLRFAFRDRDLNESKAPKKDVTPEEAKQYIVDFKNYFGYRDDYQPKGNARKISDQIAHECTLQMPTDTAAVEIEGDAVMFLVGTDDQESIRCGMKLGDIMMKKRKAHSNDDRLKAMREAYLELLKHIKNDDINESAEVKSQKTKLWIDDIRKAPDGYLWLKSVDDAMDWIDSNGADSIEVLDIDHDAGDYNAQGGDYIRVLDYLEFLHAEDLKVRIHSANAVGIQNMRRIIKKNGWTEVFDIIAESVETQNESNSSTPQYDRVFREVKQLVDSSNDKLFGVEDHLNRGNKCIKLWHGEVGRDKYGFKDFSRCKLAWNPKESWGLAEVQTFPHHEDLTQAQANDAIERARAFIADQLAESEQVDEGAKEVAQFLTLAGLLSIPGLIPQKALAQQFASVPKQELKLSSPSVKKAIQDAAVDKRKFNGLSFVNLTNLVATIIYNEAMVDYVKTQDVKCLIAIGNVISNRAGGDPSKFADVIRKKSQFFSAKHVKGGYDDASYKIYDPRSEGALSKKMLDAWNLSNKLAVEAINGTLQNVIGNRNMIGNAKLDNAGAWQAWGKDCDLVIGRHSFGYQKDQDGYASHSKQTAKTYVVKAGDTITKIAKQLGVDAASLIAKNDLKDPDKISIGQKLKV